MSETPDDANRDENGDDGLYRIAAPEPRQPAEQSTTDAPERKRRRKRKPVERDTAETRESTADSPNAPWQTDERVEKWTGDSGWREPPVVSAIWYPFTGTGWRLIPILTLVVWLARLNPIPILDIILLLLVMSLVAVLLLETANYAIEEIPGGPQTPDWLSLKTIGVGMTGLVAFAISGIPLMIGLSMMSRIGEINPYVVMLLLAASLFYLPMAFLALAERQNESALNPLVVFGGIRRMLVPYLIVCAIAFVMFALPATLFLVFGTYRIVRDLLLNFLLIYTGTALMRAVALLAKKHGVSLEDPDAAEEEDDDDEL